MEASVVSRYRVVVEVPCTTDRSQMAGLGHGIVHALAQRRFYCRSLARMRLRIVVRRTMKRPKLFFR
jgi:hypothetical protein